MGGGFPFVMLLDEHDSCEAEQCARVREHTNGIGPAFDLFVESFDWVRRPDLPTVFGWTTQNARMSARAGVRSSIRVTSSNWAWTCFASGWAKTVRRTAATMSSLARGPMDIGRLEFCEEREQDRPV